MNPVKRFAVLFFFAVVLFCGSVIAAEDAKEAIEEVSKETPKETTEKSEEPEKPFLNANFRDIYLVKDEAFITPRTHSHLFSFTGRWMRRRNIYQASSWPGTSVTALIYGQTCRVKVKAPVKEGIVEGHYFLASVDNGPQLLLTLPAYNASENPIFEFNIEIPKPDEAVSGAAKTSNVHIPHILELTSEPNYPLNLVGITLDNTIIHQGREWLQRQNKIPAIEYISDKLADAPALNTTAVYHVARELRLRQEYIVTHGKCFSPECKRSEAGLAEQYNFLSPFDGNPRPQDAREPMPSKYVFHRDDPLVQGKEPEFVVVDVGDNDLAHDIDGFEFMESLQTFLGNLIVNARPNAEIFVLVRAGRYVTETEDAIVSMRYPHLHAVKYDERRAGGDSAWYKSFYCSYILPLADPSYPYRELCGTAYEQLSVGSHVAGSLGKTVLVLLVLGGIFGTLFSRRRQLVAYVGELRGYASVANTDKEAGQ